MYTKMLWQRDKQTGTEGCRQSGDSGITKRGVLPEWHRRLGIQDSSQAQCPVSYFRRLSDRLQEYEALLLALIPLFNSAYEQWGSGAPEPWIALAWGRPDLAGNVSPDTGPHVTDYFSSLQWRPLPVVTLLYSYRSTAGCFAQKKKTQHLSICFNPWISMKTQNLCFHCALSSLSACLTDLKIGNGHICTGE